MSAVATAIVGGAIVGGAISAYGSQKAAKTSANAQTYAADLQAEAARQAREDAIAQFDPALQAFLKGIQDGKDALTAGNIDTNTILNQTMQNADYRLGEGSLAAQRAVLGYGDASNLTGTGLTGVGQARQDYGDAETRARLELNSNVDQARGDIQRGQESAIGYSNAGLADIRSAEERALGVIGIGAQSGLAGQLRASSPGGAGSSLSSDLAKSEASSMAGINSLVDKGLGTLRGYEDRGLAEIQRGTNEAVGTLEPVASTGKAAYDLQAAMSGALGPEAQAQAYSQFKESSDQSWLRQREEQALLRNQAAIGGLGGGTVRTTLQQQAVDIAAQQRQQYLENLGLVAQPGLAANSQQANIQAAGGMAGGQLVGQLGGNASGLYNTQIGVAGQLAAQRQQALANRSNLLLQLEFDRQHLAVNTITSLAGQTVAMRGQQIGIETGAGTQLASLSANRGLTLSQNAMNTGSNLANTSMVGGTNLANIIQAADQQRAQNQIGWGTGVAGVNDQYNANLSNLLLQGGTGEANLRMQQGTLLGNIATQSATNQGNYLAQAGQSQAAGTLGAYNSAGRAVEGAASGLGYYLGQPSSTSNTDQWGIIKD